MNTDTQYEINPSTYQWSVRMFTLLKKIVQVNLELHADGTAIEDGDIFLFNHFARFETFIPQYFIYQRTGAYCRSVAGSEFFGDDAFSAYLRRVGAIPNNHPRLLPFLAGEILRGRKVIVFPEGGMVKDRRVVDERGVYSVYSRAARDRRKHHTGAAALALVLDGFKHMVLHAHQRGDGRRVEQWAQSLGLEHIGQLLEAARRPTRIVPANITFYPMRVRDNLLRKGAELLNRGLSRRLSEELLIEGNILLRDTDMDIRLAEPVDVRRVWRWWQLRLLERLASRVEVIDEAFALQPDAGSWPARILARGIRRQALRVRDDYMHRMYVGVNVNLSHLASRLIFGRLDAGDTELDAGRFRRTLYYAVKLAQAEPSLNLHRSLRDPDAYVGLLDQGCPGLEQFLSTATYSKLVDVSGDALRLSPKLREEHSFDEIRLENFVEVYANEVAPIGAVRRVVEQAASDADTLTERQLADLRFDDELIAHAWDKRRFSGEEHHEINAAETATESGEPFLLVPPEPDPLAVLLVHGFLASPAEMRGLGGRLCSKGHVVMGARLRGHGTSPWDLRSRGRDEWLESVRTGFEILRTMAERVCIIGFSTGGALALQLASAAPGGLAGVAAAGVPLKFRNRNMRFVPVMHGANRLVRAVSASEGIMPFRANDSEHPHINYRHIPIRALNELRLLVADLESKLADVRCPVSLFQAERDPVVDPKSVQLICNRLGGDSVEVTMVPADRHGIVYDDLGDTQDKLVEFVESLREGNA